VLEVSRCQRSQNGTTAVPMKRCAEMDRAAPNVDCMTISAVMDAQYPSGIRSRRATRSDATAAIVVRAEWTKEEEFSRETTSVMIFLSFMLC